MAACTAWVLALSLVACGGGGGDDGGGMARNDTVDEVEPNDAFEMPQDLGTMRPGDVVAVRATSANDTFGIDWYGFKLTSDARLRVEVTHGASIDIDVSVFRVSPISGLPSLSISCSQPTSPEVCEIDLIAGEFLVTAGSSLQRGQYRLEIEEL